jgi:phage/plasmid-associated DNA primase
MYGPGNSGKDTFHTLMTSFFGQYAAVLPQKYFVVAGTRDPEAPTSVLYRVRSIRYVGNKEIPAHQEFKADVIRRSSSRRARA